MGWAGGKGYGKDWKEGARKGWKKDREGKKLCNYILIKMHFLKKKVKEVK